MLAILAAKLVASETLLIRQLGVLVFECRSFLDALDGTVARERMHQTQNISRFGSFGHFVDGLTDTLGVAALLMGVVCYLKVRTLSPELPLISCLKKRLDPQYASLVSVCDFRFDSGGGPCYLWGGGVGAERQAVG